MELKKRIEELVVGNLESEDHFLVDIVISASKGPKKVLILLDGDNGISIDDCAKVSRAVGHAIEEEELVEDAYRLEVSSPGLDHPLVLQRQYKKNEGRTVKVTMKNGEVIKGVMKLVSEEEIVVEETKKKEIKEHTISYSDINKTEVQVVF